MLPVVGDAGVAAVAIYAPRESILSSPIHGLRGGQSEQEPNWESCARQRGKRNSDPRSKVKKFTRICDSLSVEASVGASLFGVLREVAPGLSASGKLFRFFSVSPSLGGISRSAN